MHSTKQHISDQADGTFDAVFISPHLDDAILSAGNSIAELTKSGKRVLILTCFTNASEVCVTRDALQFITRSGYRRATDLFTARKKEDTRAAQKIGDVSVLHMDYIDAAFRTRRYRETPRPTYPTFADIFSGHIHGTDLPLLRSLTSDVRNVLKTVAHEKTRIYAPLGVGGHVDHILVFMLATRLKKKSVLYWEDVPYRTDADALYKRLYALGRAPLKRVRVYAPDRSHIKHAALQSYTSQYKELLGHGLGDMDMIRETYYEISQ